MAVKNRDMCVLFSDLIFQHYNQLEIETNFDDQFVSIDDAK